MNVLLITPPFTQLNTSYPATQYLKGFLQTMGHQTRQADLSIEVMCDILSSSSLSKIFDSITAIDQLNDNTKRIYDYRDEYINTIDGVVHFLQGKNPTLAYEICSENYLPQASRFDQVQDLDYSFGNLGIIDKAKYLSTLYIEDLGDFITDHIDAHFGFNRYAESLARTASSFDDIYSELHNEIGIVASSLIKLLDKHIKIINPQLVCITIPFPGNVFAAFKCGQYIKQAYPQIKIAIGGGYVNTELRKISDVRVFEFIDFITLDDGELPLQILISYLEGKRTIDSLKRTFVLHHNSVHFINQAIEKDIAQRDTGTPDYSDLYLDKYLSILEITNPMHRLWSDGRWNKLTLAHGCYWGKCSFCDISLDYIANYEPINAFILCDRISEIIKQTSQTGFHFVDEAAPPALMIDLAKELIRRKLKISWWTNIRFEKSFTKDVCRLLKASGCIAVTGGLEVASDRLLALMEKGVTVEQVSRVASAFSRAGIMVHAYLMYGFPTQTDQETIDALEVVRQMFQEKIIHSAFWHRFAMTAHSPVGLMPMKYNVIHTGPAFNGFAENDYFHEDPDGANHEMFAEGLRISLHNYMNDVGFDAPLQHWFNQKVPKTKLAANVIAKYISNKSDKYRAVAKIFYIGKIPFLNKVNSNIGILHFMNKKNQIEVELDLKEALWLQEVLNHIHISNIHEMSFNDFITEYNKNTHFDFNELYQSELWEKLEEMGLIVI